MSQAESEPRSAMPSSPAVFLFGVLLLVPALYLNPSFLAAMWPALRVHLLYAYTPMWVVNVLLFILLFFCLWQWRFLGRTRVAELAFSRHTWMASLLFSVMGLLTLLGLFEILFWQLTVHRQEPVGKRYHNKTDPAVYLPDTLLGFRAAPDRTCEDRCFTWPGQQLLFQKYYTTNPDGSRYVPQAEGPKQAHLLCFGCSFTFGIGADDAETFPSFLADGHDDVHVYNFGMGSWGPGQTLLRLQQDVLAPVEESPGAAVYLLMSDHVNRLVPGMHLTGTFTRNFPAFDLMPDGQAAYVGPFPEAYPNWMYWLDILRNEYYLKWSNVDLPPAPTTRDYELCAAILASARDEYRKHFPGNEFYVLLDPTCAVNFRKALLARLLHARGVPVLDASKAYGDAPWASHYPFDGHPLPVLHRKLARWFWDQFSAGLLTPPKP